jgi:hypothetical protein
MSDIIGPRAAYNFHNAGATGVVNNYKTVSWFEDNR